MGLMYCFGELFIMVLSRSAARRRQGDKRDGDGGEKKKGERKEGSFGREEEKIDSLSTCCV